MVSLGCPKNQIDAEHILSDLSKNPKFKIVNDANEADVVVINTCAFIDSAKQEAIETILEFVDKKKSNIIYINNNDKEIINQILHNKLIFQRKYFIKVANKKNEQDDYINL